MIYVDQEGEAEARDVDNAARNPNPRKYVRSPELQALVDAQKKRLAEMKED